MSSAAENREAVVEALISLAETARRCPYIVAKFTDDPPTMWDRRHADIDALLDRVVADA